MGNWMSNWIGNRVNNRSGYRTSHRMSSRRAADDQPQSLEHLPFQGKTLYCKNQFFGEGVIVYDGYWMDEGNENAGAENEHVKSKFLNLKKQVAVRRIKNEDCVDGWKDMANKLIYLNHNNILRVFGYEEDVTSRWRYFALEPYSATLYEYCNGKYKGAMPNESQVLYQITNGIFYLHGQRIVHGDLNPFNVVVAAQSRPVRMKISDLGLSKLSYSKQLSRKMRDGEIPFEMELCLRKYWYFYWYWTLSKKTDSLEGVKDATEDVIATGCILFYYLTRGKHLFGNDAKSILLNLKRKNPINLEILNSDHVAYEPIKNMATPPQNGFSSLHLANEKFKGALSLQVHTGNSGKQLGKGYFGHVYEGKFNGDRVAVKQMTTTTAQKEIIQREMSTHIELSHVNVVKLWDVADSPDNRFTHLVLELCAGTLADYCGKKYSGPILPPDELVLYQIANGLHYIHSRNLVHRDIKPENILISMTTPVQMKVSDLSFVKKTRHDIFSQSKIRGTLQWMAPERLKFLTDHANMPGDLPDGTIKSDAFSSGCVFFYFLTRGTHPFGKNQATVPANILLNKPEEFDSFKQNLMVGDVNARILVGLIEDMIQSEEEDRIGLPEVIKQLATLLFQNKDRIKCQFQRVERELNGKYSIRSHPTEPILACTNNKELIFYAAENSSIPFSNWRKKVTCLPPILVGKRVKAPDWNINGTQLAVGATDGSLVVWNYPDCEILFQRNIFAHFDERPPIEWNPARPNLFATFHWDEDKVFLCDSSIGDVITTIDSEDVTAAKWISGNRIAVSSFRKTIQIFEMDDSLTSIRLVKEFTHGSFCHYLEWNERTQYLASVGGGRINIWSMDGVGPIYSLETREMDEIHSFAWRPCIGNGKEEDAVEMARISAENLTVAYASIPNGVFIWNPLENEQQPRRLSDDTDIEKLAFSSDGRFLGAGSLGKLMIWSAQDWEQIYGYLGSNDEITDFSWLCATASKNLYEDKFIVSFQYGPFIVLEYAFEERSFAYSQSN